MPSPEHSIIIRTKRRVILCSILALLPSLLLLARLYEVQLLKGREYRSITRRQSTRFIVTRPVRGQILSADGQILAGNRCHYDLTMHPSLMRRRRGLLVTSSYMLNTASFIEANILNRPSKITNISNLRIRMRHDMAQPIVLFSDLTPEEMARCEEFIPQIKGVQITPRIERDYPLPLTATHILGFTGWKERKNTVKIPGGKFSVYSSKELLGNAGMEKRYDLELSGKTGVQVVIMDSSGFIRDNLPGSTAPIDGFSLRLTISARAQAAADKALQGYAGALVAIDPRNGAVIAMASAPTYNLAALTSDAYAALREDSDNTPLLNRALSGKYMPGSIIKPLVALTALEASIASQDSLYECTGAFQLGNRRIGCANRYGHGTINLIQAIAVSCNPYFIHLGLECGIDRLAPMFDAAGFGKLTGIDLDEAQCGTAPARDVAQRLWKRRWLKNDTAYVSIGQGAIELTPLQAAIYAAALASDGKVWSPFMVWQILRNDGTVVHETKPHLRNRLPVSQHNLDIVRKAMCEAVTGNHASAAAMAAAGIPLAAKTGTAEVGPPTKRHKNTWIICYGPLPQPSFAVACVIEKGTSGGRTTAPVVVNFLREWLDINNSTAEPRP